MRYCWECFIYRLVKFLPNDKFHAEKADISAQFFSRARSCLNIPQIGASTISARNLGAWPHQEVT
jgi:hypothetical protein